MSAAAGSGSIVGILLAAGSARRFGADKLLYPLDDGTPIAVAAAQRLLIACPYSISVLRPEQVELQRLLSNLGIEVRLDALAAGGMGNSLAAAVRASREAAGWLVALADMPFIKPSTLRSLVDALDNGAVLAAPVYRGRRGHPVAFGRRFLGELASLQGDTGARQILARDAGSMKVVEVDDPGIQSDIDHPDDLTAWVVASCARARRKFLPRSGY